MLPRLALRIRNLFRFTPREFRVVALVSVLFGFAALTYIWPNVRMVLWAYEFQEQQRIHKILVSENALLKLEQGSLTSLGRIRALARNELHMRSAKPEQVVTVFLK